MYYAPLESVEPGVIQYEGGRWIAEAPGVFVSEDGQDRMAFIQDGKKRVRYLIHERYRLAREMLDDALIEEVFGNHWPAGKPRFLAAEVARANGEWGKAAVEFEKIARTQSEPGRAWFRAGSAWLRAGKTGRAMAALEQAWEDGRWKAESAYLLAIAHNLQQDNDNAFLWLRRAVNADLEEPERLLEDPRLDPLRGDPRFAKLLEETGLRSDP
jgi:tetratricopeptide (TPR) repeat protein